MKMPRGWVYLEKFDDNRIRLKRLAQARESDASLDSTLMSRYG